jgi:hypothetical protein
VHRDENRRPEGHPKQRTSLIGPLWKEIFSTKKEKEPKRKKAGGLMETDAAVEKQKRFFHSSLQNA